MNAQTEITTNRAAAYRLAGIQLALTFVIASLLLAFNGFEPAFSALLGGVAYILPNAWFICFAFGDSGQATPRMVLRRFYLGEAGKLILTGLIFAACFVWIKPLHVIALFATFMVMIVVNLAGTALMNTQQVNKNH